MSTIGDIITKLRVECTFGVQLARSVNPLPAEINDSMLPIAYVHMLDCGPAGPNETIQVVTQRMRVRFAILIAAQNRDQVTSYDSMEVTRNSIIQALLGYEPNGLEPIEYVGGGIIPEGYSGNVVWWRDIFQTYQYLRSSQQ